MTAATRRFSSFPFEVISPDSPAAVERSTVVHYGPGGVRESELRMLGGLTGRRVLLLGGGNGWTATALTAAGAKVIVVEPNPTVAALVALRAEASGQPIELAERDLSELAFVRAATVDLAVAIYSMGRIADPARVFRQVHRVLRPDCALVLSVPHPLTAVMASAETRRLGYGRLTPQVLSTPTAAGTVERMEYLHTTEVLVTALTRSNFTVDGLAEPVAPAVPVAPAEPVPDSAGDPDLTGLPTTLVLRGRRLGR